MVNHSPKGIHFHEICVYYLPKGIKPLLLSWNLTLYAQWVIMRTCYDEDLVCSGGGDEDLVFRGGDDEV